MTTDYVDGYYFVYEGDADCWTPRMVDEEGDVFTSEDCGGVITVTRVKLNEAHYYKGYFFYNDMDDYEDKDEHHFMCVNTMEDIDSYMDANEAGGHFQCTYIEEWKNGVLINTVQVSDADGCCDMDVPCCRR